jgi:ubiquinone/menaquinone biosynthesis C-methylase UbiE
MSVQAESKVESLASRVRRKCLSLAYRVSGRHAASIWGNHAPTPLWKLGRLAIASSKDHAFLDRAWISGLLRVTPRKLRAPLALRLLSLSPHYWVYQWGSFYPVTRTRRQILEAEYLRNAASRKEICEKLLRRFLRPEMTVLDFGCGPGFLAKEVSAHVSRVIASDVSRGVIACAKQINAADNLQYVANGLSSLAGIADASIDCAYSFAVFQHLTKQQSWAFFREFARVLKPGGIGVCHTILKEPGDPRAIDPSVGGWVTRRVNLRMVYFTPAEIVETLQRAGLREVGIIPIESMAEIRDDIGHEQLVTFRR